MEIIEMVLSNYETSAIIFSVILHQGGQYLLIVAQTSSSLCCKGLCLPRTEERMAYCSGNSSLQGRVYCHACIAFHCYVCVWVCVCVCACASAYVDVFMCVRISVFYVPWGLEPDLMSRLEEGVCVWKCERWSIWFTCISRRKLACQITIVPNFNHLSFFSANCQRLYVSSSVCEGYEVSVFILELYSMKYIKISFYSSFKSLAWLCMMAWLLSLPVQLWQISMGHCKRIYKIR